MEDRRLNEAESLDLITKMIKNARTNQRAKINCNILLIWGYTTAMVTIIIWLMKMYDVFSLSSLLWFLIPIICYPTTKYLSGKDHIHVKSYIDRTIDYVSILFIVVCSTVAITSIWTTFPVLFMEGMLSSMWIIIIGLLIKYKPVIWGGILGIMAAHSLLFISNTISQIPIFAAIFIISIIIPGHLFKRSISKNV